MLPSQNTYRILVSRTLLGLYLLGALQSPILEALHLVSHLLINHEHEGIHSYADHVHSDSHEVLSLVDNGDSDNQIEHNPNKKPVYKVELINIQTVILNNSLEFNILRAQASKKYQGIAQDVPSPPPDCIG